MSRFVLLAFLVASCVSQPVASITTPSPAVCRLPVIQGSPGQGSGPQTAGILTIPGGQFTAATDAANGMSYDRVLKRWIQAPLSSLTPDGLRYVYADHNQQLSTFHVVDLKTDRDTVIGSTGSWVGAGLDNIALYAMKVDFQDSLAYGQVGISRGLWKIPLDGTPPVQLTADARRWVLAAAGGIYGDSSTGDVAGAPNDVVRFDLSTGNTITWFAPHKRSRVIAVDGNGAAFVITEAADEELWRVTEPGTATEIWSGATDVIRPDGDVAVDGSEVWFNSSSLKREWAIYRFTASTGLKQMVSFIDRPYSVAGPCS